MILRRPGRIRQNLYPGWFPGATREVHVSRLDSQGLTRREHISPPSLRHIQRPLEAAIDLRHLPVEVRQAALDHRDGPSRRNLGDYFSTVRRDLDLRVRILL